MGEDRGEDRGDAATAGEATARRALCEAWPRVLIADGSAATLADWWVTSRRQARAAGLPDLPRHPLRPAIQQALFEARRSRRLERGLEGAEKHLDAETAGLRRTATSDEEAKRISRLLVVSADGSERFYRQVEKLRSRFENRLEVLLLDGDETDLGSAAYGAGRRARALLLTHKDAVVRLLGSLEATRSSGMPGSAG